jgi:hypothetical protein
MAAMQGAYDATYKAGACLPPSLPESRHKSKRPARTLQSIAVDQAWQLTQVHVATSADPAPLANFQRLLLPQYSFMCNLVFLEPGASQSCTQALPIRFAVAVQHSVATQLAWSAI